MKSTAIKSLLIACAAVAVTSCDENSWNDEYLKGFEEPTATDVETVEYTLTSSEVIKIAKMKANIDIAIERGELDQLAGVAAQGYFTEQITPEVYAPAYLDSLATVMGSPIFYLDERSTLKLSYPTSVGLPAELAKIPAAERLTLEEADYQAVWGSETDFTEAFAPSKPASAFIPTYLKDKLPDAADGDFAVVTYNVAGQDPIFGGSTPPVEEFELSSVISTVTPKGGPYEVSGIVTAICRQGYIITDNSGSILAYYGSSFVADNYAIGDQLKLTATGGCYGGALQLTVSAETKMGNQKVTYPTPTYIDGSMLDDYLADLTEVANSENGVLAEYAEVTGKITISGNYVNFAVDGASNATGSAYQCPNAMKALLTDGATVTMRGYIVSKSGSSFVNLLLTEVDGKTPWEAPAKFKAGVNVSYETLSEVYEYNGSAWSAPSDIAVLTNADYAAMGLGSYNSLTTAQANTYLPIYLETHFPYAQNETVKYLVFNFYDGSNTIRNHCRRAVYNDGVWEINTINTEMNQFIKVAGEGGRSAWIYDPSVYINLPSGRNNAVSGPFYQACVDWVYENIDVPEFKSESINSGVGYVTSYGNNEYFAGTSAYQGNVDLRPTAARKQTPSVYGNMSDEDVVSTMKKNFEDIVMPAVLAQMYPDAMPGEKYDQYYVINFVTYSGTSSNETIRFKVTAKGKFEFADCTWNK